VRCDISKIRSRAFFRSPFTALFPEVLLTKPTIFDTTHGVTRPALTAGSGSVLKVR
jgi:hypothetical protein